MKCPRKDKPYLKFPEAQQARQLEGAPASKLNPRAEEVEGEGSRHGAEELEDGDKKDGDTGGVTLLPQVLLHLFFFIHDCVYVAKDNLRESVPPPLGSGSGSKCPYPLRHLAGQTVPLKPIAPLSVVTQMGLRLACFT